MEQEGKTKEEREKEEENKLKIKRSASIVVAERSVFLAINKDVF